MVLDASLLNTQHYKVRIKGKVEQSREGVAPSPTPWCSSYRKGSLWVTPQLWSPTIFNQIGINEEMLPIYIYIYIYIYIKSLLYPEPGKLLNKRCEFIARSRRRAKFKL